MASEFGATQYINPADQGWETALEDPDQINSLAYPLGYFAAQVSFAHKWTELTGDDLEPTLRDRTALMRVLTDEKQPTEDGIRLWQQASQAVGQLAGVKELTTDLYKTYCEQPHSQHQDTALTFGALAYDYHPARQTIQFHFANPERGKSPLSSKNIPERQDEFRALLRDTETKHPEARRFIAGTWLFNNPQFRSLFPPDIPLDHPPTLSLVGDSLWGQFVTRDGKVNQGVYGAFTQALQKAKTTDELIEAFPHKVLFTDAEIKKYYEFYGVRNGA